MMAMGVAGMGQSNEASTEHPSPSDAEPHGWDGEQRGKQAEPREPPHPRRISPSVVSMRRGGRRDEEPWDGSGIDIDGGAKREETRAEARREGRHAAKHEMMRWRGRSVEAYGGKHQASRGERRMPHEPVIRIISSGIEYEKTRQQRR